MLLKIRKKPMVLDAVRWDGRLETLDPLWPGCTTPHVEQDLTSPDLLIPTLEGTMHAKLDDVIVKGVHGELYPIKADIFTETYDVLSSEDSRNG